MITSLPPGIVLMAGALLVALLRGRMRQVALLTLNLNSGKIAAEVLVTQYLAPEVLPLARVTVVLGHLYPVWLGFCVG